MEQRADTVLHQRTLFAAIFAVFQVMLACLSSFSTDLLQVFTGLGKNMSIFQFFISQLDLLQLFAISSRNFGLFFADREAGFLCS